MCQFCGRKNCHLTKAEVVRHGPIIEGDVVRPMRAETEETPTTYAFRNTLAYYSLSALFPDKGDENPHAYLRFTFDEDEEQIVGWESCEVEDPLAWQTEKEFLEKAVQNKNTSGAHENTSGALHDGLRGVKE